MREKTALSKGTKFSELNSQLTPFHAGIIPYFDPNYYPAEFVTQNEHNRIRCIVSLYDNPSMYGKCFKVTKTNNNVLSSLGMSKQTSACLNETLPLHISQMANYDANGMERFLDRLTEFI